MPKINWYKLISSIIICQLAGAIGSIFTAQTVSDWYLTLNKPFFNPPGWVFGPVWTLLFVLMGISLYIIWENGFKHSKTALFAFSGQYLLNISWSFLFFYLQNPFLAFLEIILLWIFILLTIISFYKIKPKAAYLLIPYLAWVSFAALLNYMIYYLN